MPSGVESAYVIVIGTLLSVCIMIIFQRGHDRSIKLLEDKLKLYSDIPTNLEQLHKQLVAAKEKGDLATMLRDLDKQFGDQTADHISTSDQEKIRAALDKYDSHEKEGMDALREQELMQTTFQKLLELQTTAIIVAHKEVLEQLAVILDKVGDKERFRREAFSDYYKAVRRDLGVNS